jgi:hypothetical protein
MTTPNRNVKTAIAMEHDLIHNPPAHIVSRATHYDVTQGSLICW